MPYIIPGADMTVEQRSAVRRDVDRRLMERATAIKSLGRADELVVRDVNPFVDCAVAPLNTTRWVTGALAVAGTAQAYWNAAIANNQVMGFFGLANLSANPSVDLISFRVGAGAGSTRGLYHLAQVLSKMEPEGYFDMMVLYDPQEVCNVTVTPHTAKAAPGDELVLFCRIIEPIGATISGPAI